MLTFGAVAGRARRRRSARQTFHESGVSVEAPVTGRPISPRGLQTLFAPTPYRFAMQQPGDAPSRSDGRHFSRRRTRLRPVKLADLSRRFLDEGTLFDESKGGARIRRCTGRPLPPRFLVLDEIELKLLPVAVVWINGYEIGVRFVGAGITPNRTEIRRLTGRYYALPE